MPPRTIDSFFKPSSTETPSTKNPKKRARDTPSSDSASTTTSKKSKKAAPTKSGPKLKKSPPPTWQAPHLTQVPPTTPHAQKCIEKWGLLAPYDTRITEEQWAKYYDERCAVEVMNTCGSEKWKKIESDELMQKTGKLLEEAGNRLAAAMLSTTGLEEERKTAIAETLKGSVYYLELWGNEEDGMDDDEDRTVFSPRSVECKTRLYSPFGLGTSVDFQYSYHYRMFREEAKWADAAACSRDVSDCNGTNPRKCAAELQRKPNKPAESGTKLFNWVGKKTSGIAATSLDSYEDALFASSGWISPYLMYQILCAGSTATIYQEPMERHILPVQEKFKKFAGEK